MIINSQQLFAISLLDGRNWDKVKVVSEYFSEFALIRYRVYIEIEYLIFLSKHTKLLRRFSKSEISFLEKIPNDFNLEDAQVVKNEEKKINHDVKAVEYFLIRKLEKSSLKDVIFFIHFGLTSYDINIPSYALMLRGGRDHIIIPSLDKILISLKGLIQKTKAMPMLGRTHGQPALPTTMGKELAVYYQRIKKETQILSTLPIEAKLTGAVGNFNALYFIDPSFDWIHFSKTFISSIGLVPNILTTQIIPYDSWLAIFDSIRRIDNILIGFSVDIWWYISFDYFLQKKKEEEVGSSTMSHKINPITFENAEGNLGLANSIFEFFVKKLSYSRLQRDLSDSTVKRNFGIAFGHSLLAYDSLLNGLSRITPNPQKMSLDLDNHWEIFSEGIQTYLRLKGYQNAFETLKTKTRGKTMTKDEIYSLIDSLPINDADKKYLKIKNIKDYSGLAEKLADLSIKV